MTENSCFLAQFAERAIGSFKKLLAREMYYRKTNNWPALCDTVVDKLNNRVHSAIQMAPNQVTLENANQIFAKRHPKLAKNLQPELGLSPVFNIGDLVRILFPRKTFAKGDAPRTSPEVYKIARILFHPVIRYKLSEVSTNEIITGSFNQQELIPVSTPQE